MNRSLIRYDAAIIGGGPAGCFAALLLARAGCSVAVFDHTRPNQMLIGETLPPAATRIFAEADLLEWFQKQSHRPSPGIVSVWGSEEPLATDYLFSPHGDGWHIDRSRFNTQFRDVASEAGAQFFHATTLNSWKRSKNATGWVLSTNTGGELVCTVLVDASGRHPSKRLPYPFRITHDRLIAIAGFLEVGPNSQASSDYTMIEAVRDGWFYSARLPASKLVIAFMTDPDIYAQGIQCSATYLEELIVETNLTKNRVSLFPARRRAFSALSMQRMVSAQPNWIAIGDAVQSYDPLTGLGLVNAMNSAKNAAPVILEMLAGHQSAGELYQNLQRQTFSKYLENRTHYYSLERRWPQSKFWQRRSQSL
ncbi:FAD-dependent monooxygenase [Methylomonas sp. 11b]|uniref:FAD-dependent monooxygenase n=1 Tax=Methylomonas sp. 11b TaxID=1168169 RepID=UPI0004B7969A|nr:FAD-dependent monooxygenase [Methylomonas sp. 11b]